MSVEQMMQTVMEDTAYLPQSTLALTVSELTESETSEVIAFLSERPMTRTRSICALVNEENEAAHAFYRMCGFRCVSYYDTIFLKR